MILYISGLDLYTMSFVGGPGAEDMKEAGALRDAFKNTGSLFSYHYLYANRPLEMQYQAWEIIFGRRELAPANSMPFLKEKKSENKQSNQIVTVKSPELGQGRLGRKRSG